ncbi:MAG: hypothetical protein ACRC3B_13135 [Bacteroidia bacterium]
MQTAFKSFLIRLAIFSAVVGGLLLVWNTTMPVWWRQHPLSWVLLCFFVVVTALVHYILLRSAQGDPKAFVRMFMGLTTFKLFIFLLVIVAYAFTHKATAVAFILHFLVFYLLYTSFEVVLLYKHFLPKR